tara:strand:- start:203 stop:457 length:255 start_codon:yes stop_codon:yes gene_type:complete
MAYAKGFRKAIQMAVDMGIIRPVTPKSTPQPVDVTASNIQKKNTKKYASIGTSQMRSGRYSTIQTSSTGLTSSTKTSKKKLLGE